jgi:hypothetical protein
LTTTGSSKRGANRVAVSRARTWRSMRGGRIHQHRPPATQTEACAEREGEGAYRREQEEGRVKRTQTYYADESFSIGLKRLRRLRISPSGELMRSRRGTLYSFSFSSRLKKRNSKIIQPGEKTKRARTTNGLSFQTRQMVRARSEHTPTPTRESQRQHQTTRKTSVSELIQLAAV